MTWEQRRHPLRREWVVVAAHRQNHLWTVTFAGSNRRTSKVHYNQGAR